MVFNPVSFQKCTTCTIQATVYISGLIAVFAVIPILLVSLLLIVVCLCVYCWKKRKLGKPKNHYLY